MTEMLVAHTSGFLVEDGQLVEITREQSRIAPEVLDRPGYSQFFDPAVRVRGTDSTRSVVRTVMPDGSMVGETDRWLGGEG